MKGRSIRDIVVFVIGSGVLALLWWAVLGTRFEDSWTATAAVAILFVASLWWVTRYQQVVGLLFTLASIALIGVGAVAMFGIVEGPLGLDQMEGFLAFVGGVLIALAKTRRPRSGGIDFTRGSEKPRMTSTSNGIKCHTCMDSRFVNNLVDKPCRHCNPSGQCWTCNGRGYIQEWEMSRCPHCG